MSAGCLVSRTTPWAHDRATNPDRLAAREHTSSRARSATCGAGHGDDFAPTLQGCQLGSSYSASNTWAYFCWTNCRLTLSVGVSSPVSCAQS
jgi:hypothetical protein